MKQKKRVVAVLTALLMFMSSAVIAVNAITVEKDGKQYVLNSKTPATGDINVLMIRVGFSDYAVDNEDSPADSEETLLSYFDGSSDSINSYYETSSYGRLHLHCDEVFSYNAKKSRASYDIIGTFDNKTSTAAIVEETLQALENEIDFDKYDSDNDGNLDFVCLDFAGPVEKWQNMWWPHVSSNSSDIRFGGKSVPIYAVLKGNATTFIHEFGHILGADDYYAYSQRKEKNIATFDMMSSNTGDHNGFTKWSYGWLNDDNIAYVDKTTGDTTVSLAPFETPLGDGKKIAVVAPVLNRSNGFLDEYFLVEYDSGSGNNANVFEEYSLEAGFRIFHVRAAAVFDSEESRVKMIMNNNKARDNLIHNIKTEFIDVWSDNGDEADSDDYFFREGDSLTPNGYPNTGFAGKGIYNGVFTGISFTDFVTGENPSFKVSFSDTHNQDADVNFSLSYDELNANMNLMLKTDKPLAMCNIYLSQNYKYAPYLIDSEGNKLILDIKSEEDNPYRFRLSYTGQSLSVQPNTEYMLVFPEGLFVTGYNQTVPEYRKTIKTSYFLSMSVITELPVEREKWIKSNIISVTDNTFGIICIPYGNAGKTSFIEYNLNGEEICSSEFELPSFFPEDTTVKKIYGCRAFKLNDGNFALEITLFDSVSYIKIDRKGNVLSKAYNIKVDDMAEYTSSLSEINFDLYKNGLCKKFSSASDTAMFIIDFENEPHWIDMDFDTLYVNLGSEAYAVWNSSDGNLLIYDRYDKQFGKISCNATLRGVFGDGKNIQMIYSVYDYDTDIETFFADTYTKSGELIESRNITENALNLEEYFNLTHCHTNDAGFFFEYYRKLSGDGVPKIIAYDREWNYLGTFEPDEQTNYTFAGVCGLTQKKHYYSDSKKEVYVISRFNIGDFEIVAKPEEPTEPATEVTTEPATQSATEVTTEPATQSTTEAVTEVTTEPATQSTTETTQKTTVPAATAASVTDATSATQKSAVSNSNSDTSNGKGAVQTGQNGLVFITLIILTAVVGMSIYFCKYKKNSHQH